jgi:putative transposase
MFTHFLKRSVLCLCLRTSLSHRNLRFQHRSQCHPSCPSREEFRQHLRHLAVSAVQILIEQVMREELEQCIGASWGQCTPNRRGYRNGSYTRDLVTPTGRIEDLSVPRDREGAFHSQVFESYNRYEPEVAEALTQMDVAWGEHA